MYRYVVAKGHRLRVGDGVFLEAGAIHECTEQDAKRMGEALVREAPASAKDAAIKASAIAERVQRVLDRLASSLDPEEYEAVSNALERLARRRASEAAAAADLAGVGARSVALPAATTARPEPPAVEAPVPAEGSEGEGEDGNDEEEEDEAPRVVLDEQAAPAAGSGAAGPQPAKATKATKAARPKAT